MLDIIGIFCYWLKLNIERIQNIFIWYFIISTICPIITLINKRKKEYIETLKRWSSETIFRKSFFSHICYFVLNILCSLFDFGELFLKTYYAVWCTSLTLIIKNKKSCFYYRFTLLVRCYALLSVICKILYCILLNSHRFFFSIKFCFKLKSRFPFTSQTSKLAIDLILLTFCTFFIYKFIQPPPVAIYQQIHSSAATERRDGCPSYAVAVHPGRCRSTDSGRTETASVRCGWSCACGHFGGWRRDDRIGHTMWDKARKKTYFIKM